MKSDEDVFNIFLDTNTVLHFKRPDLTDWDSLVGSATKFLIVAPVLVRELEHQKIHNRSRKLRDRAQSILVWLSAFVDKDENAEVRPGVHLRFLRHSPSIDFSSNRLSHLVADDELIASALEFKQQHETDVIVVTADLGLRMKLPPHGLKCIAPNEADRLPQEPDDAERELIQARRELARYESRNPKLSVTFANNKEFSKIDMLKPGPSSQPGFSRMQLMGYAAGPSTEAMAEYNTNLANWAREISLHFPCKLLLQNSGSSEATDISIDFVFPDFITVKAFDDLPKAPKKPSSIFDPPDLSGIVPLSEHLRPRSPGKPYISRSGSLSFRIPALVHNRVLNSDRFYLRFSDDNPVCNFKASYVITCREIIDPIAGELNFLCSKED
jgi:hypothetical protein